MIRRIVAAFTTLVLGAVLPGCTMGNWSAVCEDVTLVREGQKRTLPAAIRPGIQLLRVDQDGMVVLHIDKPDGTFAAKPGQAVTVEEDSDSRVVVKIISTDPGTQLATIRIENWKMTRPALW